MLLSAHGVQPFGETEMVSQDILNVDEAKPEVPFKGFPLAENLCRAVNGYLAVWWVA